MTSDQRNRAVQLKKSLDNVQSSFPGDEIIPKAPMIYDRYVRLKLLLTLLGHGLSNWERVAVDGT